MPVIRKPNIFRYKDHREFLHVFFKMQNRGDKGFTYRDFSKLINAHSPGFCLEIIHGQRNITRNFIWRFSKAMKLNTLESMYFEFLVYYNQAEDRREKRYYLRHMNTIKEMGLKTATAP